MTQNIYEDTLYGQILPLDWDNESVSRIILLVDGEEEFIIEKDENSLRLMDLIDRWVTLEGVINEKDDELNIRVRNYTIEDEMDYESDEDW